ncbi:hypothetical protein BCV73_09850 [Paenibacillus sp. SSG-1]|uniref:hypothetical protein n=1 Tax=Paenibacillus sp. SSG-1 TaxID=1443669 RepID=UPI000B7CD14A|nr:hypothetical protein [Paenibacillus sp. SSG-1]OXL83351.1 hypothetical protein BCV73_09850 [Paenibacillus sp. SSG-1]
MAGARGSGKEQGGHVLDGLRKYLQGNPYWQTISFTNNGGRFEVCRNAKPAISADQDGCVKIGQQAVIPTVGFYILGRGETLQQKKKYIRKFINHGGIVKAK